MNFIKKTFFLFLLLGAFLSPAVFAQASLVDTFNKNHDTFLITIPSFDITSPEETKKRATIFKKVLRIHKEGLLMAEEIYANPYSSRIQEQVSEKIKIQEEHIERLKKILNPDDSQNNTSNKPSPSPSGITPQPIAKSPTPSSSTTETSSGSSGSTSSGSSGSGTKTSSGGSSTSSGAQNNSGGTSTHNDKNTDDYLNATKKTNESLKKFNKATDDLNKALRDPNTSIQERERLFAAKKKATQELDKASEEETLAEKKLSASKQEETANGGASATRPTEGKNSSGAGGTGSGGGSGGSGAVPINDLFPTWNEAEGVKIDGVIGENADGKFLMNYIPRIINIFLKFVSPIILVVLIIAGARMIIAGDESEQVEKAKKVILYSIIGVVLILLSYSIMRAVYFFFVG